MRGVEHNANNALKYHTRESPPRWDAAALMNNTKQMFMATQIANRFDLFIGLPNASRVSSGAERTVEDTAVRLRRSDS